MLKKYSQKIFNSEFFHQMFPQATDSQEKYIKIANDGENSSGYLLAITENNAES
jgi:2-polyprenyl-3-methyl-5-hydroxy-6-metoxy-1,4-benzoquinol methylase